MKREEMHQRSFQATSQITTLLKRSNNARLFTRLALYEFTHYLRESREIRPFKNLEEMMEEANLPSPKRSSMRRFLREHFDPQAGITPKTIRLGSFPGASTFGERELEDKPLDFVYSQEYARA